MKVAPTERMPERPPRRRVPPAAPLLLLLLLLFVFASVGVAAPGRNSPAQARGAATLADYRRRVGAAVASLEELAESYDRAHESRNEEVWSKEESNSDFIVELPKKKATTLASVRGLLPPGEGVERDGGVVAVDNAWVQKELGALESEQEYEKLAAGLHALAARLRALKARLGEPDASKQGGIDPDAERGRLNSILRRPEFNRQAPPQRGALERMIEDFAEWLSSILARLFSGTRAVPGGSPRVSQLTLIVVVGLCLLVLAYGARRLWLRRRMGAKSLGRRRGARVVLGEHLEADQTAFDLLDEAERLARGGELRGAIRKAYVALLCELGDRGVLRLAQHKTNRDYLDAVRRAARPRLYAEMLPLTSDFELHWYGLRAASDADWQSFKTRCRTMLDSAQ